MSKQSEAKLQQRYDPKPARKICSYCDHFKYDSVETPAYNGLVFYEVKNIRCGIGGFAVKKTATCDKWLGGNNGL